MPSPRHPPVMRTAARWSTDGIRPAVLAVVCPSTQGRSETWGLSSFPRGTTRVLLPHTVQLFLGAPTADNDAECPWSCHPWSATRLVVQHVSPWRVALVDKQADDPHRICSTRCQLVGRLSYHLFKDVQEAIQTSPQGGGGGGGGGGGEGVGGGGMVGGNSAKWNKNFDFILCLIVLCWSLGVEPCDSSALSGGCEGSPHHGRPTRSRGRWKVGCSPDGGEVRRAAVEG
eukprot:scaffold940_cov569-Prasinococcus_capsulatus_cf.AAC.8